MPRGGADTTRLTLECAALAVSEGLDVAVLHAAYATHGLTDWTPARVDPNMTELCLDDTPLADGLGDPASGVGQRRHRSAEFRESFTGLPELRVGARRQVTRAGRRHEYLAAVQ